MYVVAPKLVRFELTQTPTFAEAGRVAGWGGWMGIVRSHNFG